MNNFNSPFLLVRSIGRTARNTRAQNEGAFDYTWNDEYTACTIRTKTGPQLFDVNHFLSTGLPGLVTHLEQTVVDDLLGFYAKASELLAADLVIRDNHEDRTPGYVFMMDNDRLANYTRDIRQAAQSSRYFWIPGPEVS